MKKVFFSVMLAALTLCMSGCGPVGMIGVVYTNVTAPYSVTGNTLGNKVGTATTWSVLGLIADGQAGINQAAKNAGITQISHVDVKVFSILGVFTTNKYFVYGE